MFDFDDPIPLLTALRQWTKDERKGLVALIRLCEWAVEGSFVPSGFHMMSGRRPDPLDVLQAARAIAAGTSFTETWNHDPDTGLHPVATSLLDPVQYIDALIISGAEAADFRQRHEPSGWFRRLFGLRSDHLPPRCPDFDVIEQRHQEYLRRQAEDAYTRWRATPEGMRVAGPRPPARSADHPVPEPPPAVTGTPGRPEKHITLVLAEFQRRAEIGDLAPSLAEQSRLLEEWFHETHPEKQAPTAKTIENRLRPDYRQAMNAPAAPRNHPPKSPPKLS